MKILYTCAGDTDPIRNFHDGGILHIARYYKPDKAVIFLSADMEQKEETQQRYSLPLKHVLPDCEVVFIKSGITDPHHLDSLQPMIEEFYKIREAYASDTILLNLSSGTPQMKMIMAFLATEYANAIGIQVDSPERGSNRQDPPSQDSDDVQALIETNLDEEPDAPSRCHEPQLRFLRYKQVVRELRTLIGNYAYEEAYRVYKDNKDILAEDIGKLLLHAAYRVDMKYDKALDVLKNYGQLELKNGYDKKLSEMWEYLMIMDVRVKQGLWPEFFVKMTPFLYRLVCWYLFDCGTIKQESIVEKSKGKLKVRRDKLEQNYPTTLRILDETVGGYTGFRDKSDLSFFSAHVLICNEPIFSHVPEEIRQQLVYLRAVEEGIRNHLAHNIEPLNERDIDDFSEGKPPTEILAIIRSVFFYFVGSRKKQTKLIYDSINNVLEEKLL
jgi:CRISPR type III-A/MTUBE-associated protein Csm6